MRAVTIHIVVVSPLKRDGNYWTKKLWLTWLALLCGATQSSASCTYPSINLPSPTTKRNPPSSLFRDEALTQKSRHICTLKYEPFHYTREYDTSKGDQAPPPTSSQGCSSAAVLRIHVSQKATTAPMVLVFSSAKSIWTGVGTVQFLLCSSTCYRRATSPPPSPAPATAAAAVLPPPCRGLSLLSCGEADSGGICRESPSCSRLREAASDNECRSGVNRCSGERQKQARNCVGKMGGQTI